MARFEFKMPDIGEGIAEAEIVALHVKAGDVVEEDAPLADLMTDKATVEMTAPVSGKVLEIAGSMGDQIAIGSVLAVFETDDETSEQPPEVAASREAMVGVKSDPAMPEVAPKGGRHRGEEGRSGDGSSPDEADSNLLPLPFFPSILTPIQASPAVRARAKDLGIDLAQVRPGDKGRVRHSDLDAFLNYNADYRPAGQARPDEQVKVIGMRRRIAENMTASKRHIPHFTYVEEIDVTDFEAMRADLNADLGGRPKLTMLPLLIVAICKTVPYFPMINARHDDKGGVVTRHGAVHLGMATQTDAGLMVPVIRDAQAKNIWQLATEITRLAESARSGKAKVEELSGSTLTITSLGRLGGIATTPVINRPEVAIIGPNKIVERPVFKGDYVVRAKLMNLSISCDHRVVDGWDAACFVQGVRHLLEKPALLLVH